VLAVEFDADNMAPGMVPATMLVGAQTESLILSLSFARRLVVLSCAALIGGAAQAQIGAPATNPSLTPPSSGATSSVAPAPAVQFPALPTAGPLSASDRNALAGALSAARRGDGGLAQSDMALIGDTAARKLALWAIIDIDGEQLSFLQLDQARRDLAGWPRAARRQQAAEKTIEISGLGPQQVIAWFGGEDPQTPQGAMALAAAYQLSGRAAEAQTLIKHWWRTQAFDVEVQRAMRARFGALLTADDDIAREDALLYGSQGSAAHDMLQYLGPDQRAVAEARMALRDDSYRAAQAVAAVPAALINSPGLAVERARYLEKRGLEQDALTLLPQFPDTAPNADAANRIWSARRLLINAALRAGDYRSAYAAATHHGLVTGQEFTEAEFYAGWLAFSKLRDPALADTHFAEIQRVGLSPITQARALYWRGRAAEAQGEEDLSQTFFQAAARYYTTFYGQLAAERAGQTTLTLLHDPVITPADQARFNGREVVRAARDLGDLSESDMFRSFVLSIAETLPDAEESALLVDMVSAYGDQDLAMKTVRMAAQHGQVLPERGYPIRNFPVAPEAPEPAIVFGITRQESGFDPRVRSGVGARGMMQLMPETAHAVARRIGEPYSPGMLDEPDYNMRLGAAYLGHVIGDFGGSYVMAAAAYNAGPGRPAEWAGYCGDPRSSTVDPVDFIECIPFSETRNYVMRVLEATTIYRARLNGGVTRLTLSADLKRGGYVYGPPPAQTVATATPAKASRVP
jgi:soluble lytic murein transglycosylase